MADYRESSTDPAVKLSGVAALTADQAMVVALSPNSNSVSVVSQPELVTTGTITTTDIVVAAPAGNGVLLTGTPTAGSYVAALATGGNASAVIGITGLTSGTIYYEGSADSTTGVDGGWVSLNMKQAGIVNTQISSAATASGLYRGNTAGIKWIRMRSVGALTGTPVITLRLSAGVAGEFLFGSIPTGANSIGTVQQAALTKGTQGATGVSTQDLKDSGRVSVVITCYQAPGIITTEALFAAATFASTRDGGTPTTGQQFTVTTGKRFRLQAALIGIKNTAAAAGTSKLVLRYAAAGGTLTNASPIAQIWDFGSNATVANTYIGPNLYEIPDGLELLPASALGFTVLSSAVTMLHTITLLGFEY